MVTSISSQFDLAFILSGWHPVEDKLGIEEFLAISGSTRILLDLFCIAIFGGIFTVPLYTLIQQRSDRTHRSRVIGANNFMNTLFMVVGSGLLMLFLQMKMSIPTILLVYSTFNFLIAIYIYSLVPEFTLRFLAWILARCLYRLKSTLASTLSVYAI